MILFGSDGSSSSSSSSMITTDENDVDDFRSKLLNFQTNFFFSSFSKKSRNYKMWMDQKYKFNLRKIFSEFYVFFFSFLFFLLSISWLFGKKRKNSGPLFLYLLNFIKIYSTTAVVVFFTSYYKNNE